MKPNNPYRNELIRSLQRQF